MSQTVGVIRTMALGIVEMRSDCFLAIDKAKFRKPVIPGAFIEYQMKARPLRDGRRCFHG